MTHARPVSLAVLVWMLLTAAPGNSAAVVELLVVDELDRAVTNTRVSLSGIGDGDYRFHFRSYADTDAGGRVVFNGVEPGRYAVYASGGHKDFVSLKDHPSIIRPSITVETDHDELQTKVRLVRGIPVVFRVTFGGADLPGARVLLHDLDREYRAEIGMGDRIEQEVRLVAGRWAVRVEPAPGYLLTSVEVNRTVLPNDVAEFDLPAGATSWYVNFEFAAPALIWGKVTFEGEPFSVRIVSHLQEAGPWLPAVQARGGSAYERVAAGPVYPTWEYEMVVPDGRWIVQPESPGLERADPQQMEVRLEPGEERRIDFTVGGSSEGRGRRTRVRVEDEERRRVREATVEAWPADPDARDDAPIADGVTYWGDAVLRGLADEQYLFVAGKPGHVESSIIAKAPDGRDKRITLRLGRGATVHAVARDEDEQSIPAVDVALTRQDDFVSLLASREIAEWARHPTATTDGTGHLWMRGVYPGRYLLSGTLRGRDAMMFFAEFRNRGEGRWERKLDKNYHGTETDEVEIRLTPAGSVRASLHCSDGSELPAETDVLVLSAQGSTVRDDPSTWRDHAVYDQQDYVLEGDERDTFHVGPLDFGAYHVLVRPEGHNRWTWALGTESPEDASVLAVGPGEPTDLGAIAIDCAPGVSVRPQVPDGVELPDLVATAAYDPLAECVGTLTLDGEERSVGHARLVAEASRIQFRDLREGRADLAITLWNPFFLPRPDWTILLSAELERGKTVEVKPLVARIGGAIELTLSETDATEFGALLVVRTADDTAPPPVPWIFEIDGRSVLIPSLPAGRYEVGACRDRDCEQRIDLWQPVDVFAGVVSGVEAKDTREPVEPPLFPRM